MAERRSGLNRRAFLERSAAAALGACAVGLPGTAPGEKAAEPRVRRYKKLGRTGLEISDISFGSSATRGPEASRYALERGVNYFDTAESYPVFERNKGGAERALRQALAGKRDEVVIASKTVARAWDRRGKLMRRLEATLRRLQTDRVDIYFNHSVNNLERLRNPEWFEFAERAKQQGKIRFTGMSGHGGRLIECLNAAIDENLFDVILAAHNFGQDPAFYERFTKSFDIVANQKGLPEVFKRAMKKGIGVIVMKTLMGARLNDMRPYEWSGSTFAQSAFRWVLSNPDVDALIVTMPSRKHVDEYLGASGAAEVARDDLRLLRHYALANGASICRQGCGACADSCWRGVPIADVLRARMYANDYGDPELGRAEYARLGVGASPCLSCAETTCGGACPYGLDIPALTRSTPAIVGVG